MTGILIHMGATKNLLGTLKQSNAKPPGPLFLDESCQTTTEQLLKADMSFGHEKCFLVSRLTPKN